MPSGGKAPSGFRWANVVPKKAPIEKTSVKHRSTAFTIELTINALESAAWRDKDVITIRTKELHGIGPWDVYPSTGYNIASNAIDAWTSTKNPVFIFLSLSSFMQSQLDALHLEQCQRGKEDLFCDQERSLALASDQEHG